MITIRRRQILALTAAFMTSVSGVALAQSAYPSQTVKIIVPFTPGTGMDTIARVVAPRLSERLGQPVVVQNQPGASGNIGADAVAKWIKAGPRNAADACRGPFAAASMPHPVASFCKGWLGCIVSNRRSTKGDVEVAFSSKSSS